MTNEVNTARLVRVTATVPEICMHNVKLGPGCFCPHCPTASVDDLRHPEPVVTNLADRLRAYGDGSTDQLSRMDALEAANLISLRQNDFIKPSSAEPTREQAVHYAITRALAEAGVKQEVLVGMCIEVGLEAYRDALNRGGERG